MEHIYDVLKQAVEKRSPPPLTPFDLWTAFQDSWCELPPRYIQTLVKCMPRHVAASSCSPGDPTRGKLTL